LLRRVRVAGNTPEYSLDPGRQLSRTEWFGYVVVCPQFETDDPVYFVTACSQEDDGNRCFFAQFPAEIESAHVRQADVQDYQVWTEYPNLPEAVSGSFAAVYFKAFLL
jgi:hypothetical protein